MSGFCQLDEILPYAAKIITIETPSNERALDCKTLADIIKNNYNIPISFFENISMAVEHAFELCDEECGIVACGSLSNLRRIKEEVSKYADRKKGI